MSDKQTRCPNCSTVYKVSVTQLTVAQGMVCCPKCSTEFNALLNLYEDSIHKKKQVKPPVTIVSEPIIVDNNDTEHHLLDIFERKVESSNINLRTYLNNLSSFNNDPITTFPVLNLSASAHLDQKIKPRRNFLYFLSWFVVNLCLVFILIFQILWFNPNLLNKSKFISSSFISLCHAFKCETIDERYTHIAIENLKIKKIKSEQIEIRGDLKNYYKSGLKLPLLKVNLIKNEKIVYSTIIMPQHYLVSSLNGITRIPPNSPYNFKFTLNTSQMTFDDHKLEVIRP